MKIYVAQINPLVGEIKKNTDKIIHEIHKAKREKVDIFLAPELSICGYPPQDLLFFEDFIKEIEKSILRIKEVSKDLFIAIGAPRKTNKDKGKILYNSAVVMYNGEILGYKDKTLLPEYDVFNEARYFEPGEEEKIWEFKGKRIGIFICEDVWEHAKISREIRYWRDPVEDMKKLKPDLVLSLSASPYYFKKNEIRLKIYGKAAKTLKCQLILCNQVGANDQLVFDGYSTYFDEEGNIRQMAKGFVEDGVVFDLLEKFSDIVMQDPIKDLYDALVLGVRDYFSKQGFSKACIGLSGGIDSSLTACIAVDALGSQNILGVRMPSRFSSLASVEDAGIIAENLRIEIRDIPIDGIFQDFLDLFSPIFYGKSFNTAEENIQARIRGIILMGISNKLGYVVLSTGNKSEMAIGYTTLYGDMCGGLGVLNDVSKTLIYKIAEWINKKKEIIPKSIFEKEPSAELKPNQVDKEAVYDYSIVDLILEEYVENHMSIEKIIKKHKIDREIVQDLVERIHIAEFKRRQGPLGIKVSKKSFTMGRLFPVVQGWV